MIGLRRKAPTYTVGSTALHRNPRGWLPPKEHYVVLLAPINATHRGQPKRWRVGVFESNPTTWAYELTGLVLERARLPRAIGKIVAPWAEVDELDLIKKCGDIGYQSALRVTEALMAK